MTTIRLYRAGLSSGQTKVRLFREGLLSSSSSVTKVRYYRSGLASGSSNVAPSVDAGAAQTVESGAVVTLRGAASDIDGVVASRTWSLNGTVKSTSETFTLVAPVVASDTVLNYVYAATDDGGVTSTATTQITVRRAPLIIKNSDGSFSGLVARRML